MAGSSRGATKRLMTELQTYQKDPNEELLDLGPADEDVMHWRAVMKGVEGTAYEGTPHSIAPSCSYHTQLPQRSFPEPSCKILTYFRRHMAPRHPRSPILSQLSTHRALRNTHLSPQCRLQDWRDLP